MRKFYLALSLLLLTIIPTVGFAAFDDVTLTTDTVISVNGITLNVNGSSAVVESITINPTTFSVNLVSGSTIEIVSPDRKILANDAPNVVVATNSCNSGESRLRLTSSQTVTVIVTPSATACSSGGSGGGGSSSPVVETVTPTPTPTTSTSDQTSTVTTQTTPVSTVVETPVSTPTPVYVAPSPFAMFSFTRALTVGSVGEDVKQLQQFLNASGIIIALAGPGSPGSETDRFGTLTQLAVQKFQDKYGIAGPGVVGYGRVGPKTLSKLQELTSGSSGVSTSVTTPSVSTGSAGLSRKLNAGMSGEDVKYLQQLLNKDVDTQIASSGVGSPGSESTYFGSLTEKAVQKFQVKHGIVSSGTPESTGFGAVGPKTKAKLLELAQ